MVRLKRLELMYQEEVNWKEKRWWLKKRTVDLETVEAFQFLVMTNSRIAPWSEEKQS